MQPLPDFGDDQIALTVALQAAIGTLALVVLNTEVELTVGHGEHAVRTIPWLTGLLHEHGHPETLNGLDVTFDYPGA